MLPPARILALLGLCSLGACAPPESGPAGGPLHLLTRRPDVVMEQPGKVENRGDVPGTASWGISEGPGWSQKLLTSAAGTEYRETNQHEATMFLPATEPENRVLQLALWCVRSVESEPAGVRLLLNGVDLGKGERFELGREPTVLPVNAPAELWSKGLNELTIVVPVLVLDGKRVWDTLGCAQVVYAAPRLAEIDIEAESLRLVHGTGVRYALELTSEAEIILEATRTGPGTLTLRTGTMDPRTGKLGMQPDTLVVDGAETSITLKMPLPRHAGSVRLLELSWESPAQAELTVTRLEAREDEPVVRPPIVFISIDTFAARHLSMYGYGRETTPELARFMEDALTFERCLANAPWTLPSYLSVMSGLYPRAHSVVLEHQAGVNIEGWDLWQLADNRWTLAEALRARGYRTAGFVDTYWLSPQYGVNQGFDLYNGDAALALFTDPSMGIRLIVEHLLPDWLETVGDERPPFLFVHALDAHGPYLPEEPFRDIFTGTLASRRTEVPAGSHNQTYRAMPLWMSLTMEKDPAAPVLERVPLEDVVARYDETLLKVDHYLGKLFDKLREEGLYDDAVIVVTGDHGETFGSDVYGHGVMLEDVLHVPLLIKLPGNERGGERVRRPVSLVDLYPTLLELAGVPPDGQRLHGSDLLGSAPSSGDAVLFSEAGHVEQYSVTVGRWRLLEERPGSESSDGSLLTHPRVDDEWLRQHAPEILTRPLTHDLLVEIRARPGVLEAMAALRKELAGPYYSLFDLEADPQESNDLAAQEPDRVREMKALLEAEKQRSQEARDDANPSAFVLGLPQSALDALKALGYGGESH